MRSVELNLRPSGSVGHSQHGQALLETLMMGGLISMLLLMVVVLARQMDLRVATVHAAHALALECAVRPSECDDAAGLSGVVGDEIRARYFGAVGAPIKSGDRLAVQLNEAIVRPFWRGLDGLALVSDPAQISLASRGASFDAGQSVAVGRPVSSIAQPAAQLAWEQAGPNRFGFEPSRGLLIAEVRVVGRFQLPRTDPGSPLLVEPFELKSRSALLSDAWNGVPNGSSLRPLEDRVRSGSELGQGREALLKLAYAPVQSLLKVFAMFGLEPLADQFERMRIDLSILPPDVMVAP
jgi:hypothetical protein